MDDNPEPIEKPISRVEHAINVRERIERERRIMQRIRNQDIIASVRRPR